MARAKVKPRFSIESARHRKALRASALTDLAEGRLDPVGVVQRPPDALSGTDLWDALLSFPGLGRESARRVCERAGVWPHLRLSELSDGQRRAVVDALPVRKD